MSNQSQSVTQKLAQMESIYRTTKQKADSAVALNSQLAQEKRKTASLQTMVLSIEDAERAADTLVDKGMLQMTQKRAFCERVVTHPSEFVDTFVKVANMVGNASAASSFGSADGHDIDEYTLDPMERFARGV